MRCFIQFLLMAMLAMGCSNKPGATEPNGSETASDSSGLLYPFPQFIEDQLAWLDSMPLAVEKIVFVNGIQSDSSLISKADFRLIAQDFAAEDPNRHTLRSNYREESFEDLTLNAITFSISTTNPNLTLQNADILLNPETRKVKHVILKRQLTGGDSSEIQNILWVANMKCQVSSVVTRKDGTSYNKTVNYIWDRPLP
jgi:hypothetical protein